MKIRTGISKSGTTSVYLYVIVSSSILYSSVGILVDPQILVKKGSEIYSCLLTEIVFNLISGHRLMIKF